MVVRVVDTEQLGSNPQGIKHICSSAVKERRQSREPLTDCITRRTQRATEEIPPLRSVELLLSRWGIGLLLKLAAQVDCHLVADQDPTAVQALIPAYAVVEAIDLGGRDEPNRP